MKYKLLISILFFLLASFYGARGQTFAHTNALIHEKSPYLLQHAHNPVNWNAWHENPLELAVKQQKLMVISIGYAACHWCHVMEKESFSDSSVAKLMNENFINIKIDREERPDIDQVYLLACQLTNPSGCGWPLNVIALPDGKPVWIGSYLPKKEWIDQLNFFLEAKKNTPEKLNQYAKHLKEGIGNAQKIKVKDGQKSLVLLEDVLKKIKTEIDFKEGGLKGIPKFPMPGLFDFLLRYSFQYQDDTLQKSVFNTLNHIADGGIYDHLAGGFARYTTDEYWRVPHFEKMLYDNAQLISLYAKAYGISKNERYKTIVEQSIEFLEQNFKDKSGGFYSSIDADSEGKEGVYYTWTKQEVKQILGKKANQFCEYFGVTTTGNWEKNRNILYQNNQQSADNQVYKSNIKKLLLARNKRPKPAIDHKIITAWNALMLGAYIDAFRILGNSKYLTQAKHLADFIIQNQLQSNGQLKRLSYQNKEGFLDDYAFTIDAFAKLYQCSFELKYLTTAQNLVTVVFENFKQNENDFFSYSSNNQLFINDNVEIIDGVLPSSNAVLANVLHDLGVIFQEKKYEETSEKMLKAISNQANSSDYYYWGNLLMKSQSNVYEVCVVGKNARNLAKKFLKMDNIILIVSEQNENVPLLKSKFNKGKTMIYICQNTLCKKPTQSIKQAMQLLKER